ncbi:MAG: hypothetical protein GY759_05585 [Chloroflexi bacterium]|nr:hypothetical protein [Chloroflexota bacterium]
MKLLRVIMLLVLTSCVVSAFLRGQIQTTSQTQTSLPAVPPTPRSPFFPEELVGVNLFQSHSALLSDVLCQSFKSRAGQDHLTIRRLERDSVTSSFSSPAEQRFSLPFATTSVASRPGGDVVYVTGINDKGINTIYQLAFRNPKGSYYVRTSLLPAGLGTPMPSFFSQASIETIGDAPWTAPISVFNPPAMKEIFASDSVGPFRAMAVDPEGRFLLLLSYPDNNLYRLSLSPLCSTLELLLVGQGTPGLKDMRTIHFAHDKDGNERVVVLTTTNQGWVITEGTAGAYMLLIDPENDGIFQPPVSLSFEEAMVAMSNHTYLWDLR